MKKCCFAFSLSHAPLTLPDTFPYLSYLPKLLVLVEARVLQWNTLIRPPPAKKAPPHFFQIPQDYILLLQIVLSQDYLRFLTQWPFQSFDQDAVCLEVLLSFPDQYILHAIQ